MHSLRKLFLLPSAQLSKVFGCSLAQFPSHSSLLSQPIVTQQSSFATAAKPKKKTAAKKTTTTKKASSGKKTTTKKKTTAKKTTAKKKTATKKTAAKKKKTTTTKRKVKKKVVKKKKLVKKKKKKIVKPKPYLKRLGRRQRLLLKQFPDPNKPKLPLSGYLLFVKEYYKSSFTTPTMAQTAVAWQALSNDEKDTYNQRVMPQRNEYKEAAEEYNINKDEKLKEWHQTLKQLIKERPPKSGYNGYVQENKHVFKQVDGSGKNIAQQGIKELASRWQQLSEYEKGEYNDKYRQLYQNWKNRVDSYYD